MGAMAWLMVAVLASSFGGAEAQHVPGYAPYGGETFENDAIYEVCHLAAHQACSSSTIPHYAIPH